METSDGYYPRSRLTNLHDAAARSRVASATPKYQAPAQVVGVKKMAAWRSMVRRVLLDESDCVKTSRSCVSRVSTIRLWSFHLVVRPPSC